MFFKKDKSIHMSIPKSYELYGVTIRKLPIAKYIAVLREVNDLPSLLLGELLPDGGNFSELLIQLQTFDRTATLNLIGRLLKVVPEEFCKILSQLLDIPKERLLDVNCENPLLLSELAEIIQAFWKINDMSDFLMTVRNLKPKKAVPTRSTMNTGSSDGLQSPNQSESQSQK